jgi:hypothetical protein
MLLRKVLERYPALILAGAPGLGFLVVSPNPLTLKVRIVPPVSHDHFISIPFRFILRYPTIDTDSVIE